MNRLSVAVLAVPLLSGCLVENLCERQPDLAECQVTQVEGPARLVSRRLPLLGGELVVQVMGSPESVDVLLSPAGLDEKRVPLRLMGDGLWHAMAKPQELWPTVLPGPVPIKVVTPNQQTSGTLRLYVPPSFGPDVSRSAKIVWLSVVSRHVIALEQGVTDRTFGDWTYQPPVLNRTGSVPAALGYIPQSVGVFSVTETAALRLIPSGAGFALQQSPLGELRYSDIEASLDYASVTALAAGKRGAGNLLAVAGEGGSGPFLRAYRLPDGGSAATSRLTVSASTGPLLLLSAGTLDDNDSVDLVSVGKDGSAAVWLATATSLARDESLSQSLSTQLGSDPVRALSIGDIDRDGLADVIISRKSQLSWLANQADGSFAAPSVLLTLPDNATTIDVGLLDGNDSPDVVVSIQSITLNAYLNQAQ
ncbi:MAG: VCBS repeat-containing protein [Polyangia bacterium]